MGGDSPGRTHTAAICTMSGGGGGLTHSLKATGAHNHMRAVWVEGVGGCECARGVTEGQHDGSETLEHA